MMQQQYIESGVLEAYVIGAATPEEVQELMYMKAKYPEVDFALQQLELDMENIAQQMAVTPPAGTWNKIADTMDELVVRQDKSPQKHQPYEEIPNYDKADTDKSGPNYIEVEAESNHMRIHKNWKWVFAAVFILGKIFLAFAIYFYLENRQTQLQLNDLKTELRQLKK
jgi:hypothetical protein